MWRLVIAAFVAMLLPASALALLKTNNLTGFNVIVTAAGTADIVITNASNHNDDDPVADPASFSATWDASSDANRAIIVGYVAFDDGTGTPSLQSATIAGVAATTGSEGSFTDGQDVTIGFFAARVSSSSTNGTIELAFDASNQPDRGLVISTWTVDNLVSLSPENEDYSDTTDTYTGTVSVSAGGVMIGIGGHRNALGGDSLTSGAAITLNANPETGGDYEATSGNLDVISAATTSASMTYDGQGNSQSGGGFTAWR